MAAETAQFAAVRRAAAPLSLIAGGRRCSDPQQQTRRPNDWTDRQTNGRTPVRFIDSVPHSRWIKVSSHQLNSHKRLSGQCNQSFAIGLGNSN